MKVQPVTGGKVHYSTDGRHANCVSQNPLRARATTSYQVVPDSTPVTCKFCGAGQPPAPAPAPVAAPDEITVGTRVSSPKGEGVVVNAETFANYYLIETDEGEKVLVLSNECQAV